jgi:hypothetical protein
MSAFIDRRLLPKPPSGVGSGKPVFRFGAQGIEFFSQRSGFSKDFARVVEGVHCQVDGFHGIDQVTEFIRRGRSHRKRMRPMILSEKTVRSATRLAPSHAPTLSLTIPIGEYVRFRGKAFSAGRRSHTPSPPVNSTEARRQRPDNARKKAKAREPPTRR